MLPLLTLDDFKGAYAVDFTHEDQFTSHGEYYSACENSCLMSLEALQQLYHIREKNPNDVIVMSSGLSTLGFGD